MPRPSPVPSYRHHKPSGQAVVTIRTAAGERRDVYLGVYNSPESRAEYGRIVAELAAGPVSPARASGGSGPTVDQVLLAFWKYAEQHYRRPDGSPTFEISEYKQTFKALRPLYGHTPAAEFGPLALKAVRAAMVGKGWSRKLINARVGRVKRMFKWAASEQIVPVAAHTALGTVTGLQKGRGAAPETEPVVPVAWEVVVRTLPYLRPTLRGMIEVQWLTGMRPGEVCALRPCDIDTTGAVWVYRPPYSKMSYKGQKRAVMIGPRAQEVLKRFTPAESASYYFCPAASVAQFHAERAANRKTPKYTSHIRRNAALPKGKKRKPRARYTSMSYGYAIRRAVERANAVLIEAAVDVELQVPEWAPNQLRHSLGTAVRDRFGLEAAQVVLGHERADVTQVYAEKNLALAAKVAAEIG